LLLLWQVQPQPCTDVCKVLVHGLCCACLSEPDFMQLLTRRSQQVKHLQCGTQQDDLDPPRTQPEKLGCNSSSCQ
jgi:hypothetical protein